MNSYHVPDGLSKDDKWKQVHRALWRCLDPQTEAKDSVDIAKAQKIPEERELISVRNVLSRSGIEVVDEDLRNAAALCRQISKLVSEEALSWLARLVDAEGTGYWSPEEPRDVRKKFSLSGYEASILPDQDGNILGMYANRIVMGETTPARQSETLQALSLAVRGSSRWTDRARVSIDNEVVIDSDVNRIHPGVRRLLYFAMHGYNVAELRAKSVQLAVTVCRRKNPHALKAHLLCGWRRVYWEGSSRGSGLPEPPRCGTRDLVFSKAGTDWDILVLNPFDKGQNVLVELAPKIVPLKICDSTHLAALDQARLPSRDTSSVLPLQNRQQSRD